MPKKLSNRDEIVKAIIDGKNIALDILAKRVAELELGNAALKAPKNFLSELNNFGYFYDHDSSESLQDSFVYGDRAFSHENGNRIYINLNDSWVFDDFVFDDNDPIYGSSRESLLEFLLTQPK